MMMPVARGLQAFGVYVYGVGTLIHGIVCCRGYKPLGHSLYKFSSIVCLKTLFKTISTYVSPTRIETRRRLFLFQHLTVLRQSLSEDLSACRSEAEPSSADLGLLRPGAPL